VTEIRLSNGATVKTIDPKEDLRRKLTAGGDRFVTVMDKNGREWDINPAQVVALTDERERSGRAEFA